MGKKINLFVICFMLLDLTIAYSQEIWTGKDGNIRNVNTRALLVDGSGLYLATASELYRAHDVKDEWRSIFCIPSSGNEISCLSGNSKNIFVGTRKGLFRSQDLGTSWKNVFRTIIPEKNNMLSIEVSGPNARRVTIGTMHGIFTSDDAGDSWNDISGALKNRSVRCIAIDKLSIYAGGDSGLYVKRDGHAGWDRLIVKNIAEKDDEGETAEATEAESKWEDAVNCIKIKGNVIYIATDRTILYSEMDLGPWRNIPVEGTAGTMNYILPSAKYDKLYCGTTKGVFELAKDGSRWLELYKGMDKPINVKGMVFGDEDEKSLWAVTDKGVYKLESGRYLADQYVDVEKSLKVIKTMFEAEPSFQELQRAAIKFAEVGPDKIRRWRSEARMRALLPKVSFGLDKDKSTNSEIYTSATRDYVVFGPDDVSGGWDMSVSWELGDLIWSDDQTNIDVRSRLMVQLRNDILDELRRTYYERKRIQFELMTEPPKDLKARVDKELRLQELTSHIDDLTGNYLSRQIKIDRS